MLAFDLQVSHQIVSLADEMASAAASFNSQQGYEQFIRARAALQEAVLSACAPVDKKVV